jgi:hypothetical protein
LTNVEGRGVFNPETSPLEERLPALNYWEILALRKIYLSDLFFLKYCIERRFIIVNTAHRNEHP